MLLIYTLLIRKGELLFRRKAGAADLSAPERSKREQIEVVKLY